MSLPILSSLIIAEEDVVVARQRAHQIARTLGLESVEQTRIATAVSEIARNAYEYAKGGKVDFLFDDESNPQTFIVRISDKGKGITHLQDILEGQYQSQSGMGIGIIGTRRLMDVFKIDTTTQGTTVTIGKNLSKSAERITTKAIGAISEQLTKENTPSAVSEMKRQNREILVALQELERRQSELSQLNQELAETNRGVVALYAELDSRAEYARRADAVKTRFLSHMSHEFRTPVNSVLNLTDFLLNRIDGDLTQEQEKQIRLIRQSMENLSEMVNDLLDLAKVEAGKVTMRIEQFSVTELFGSLRGMFRPMSKNPEVELVFVDPDDTILMNNDQGKIAQILRNFVSNAMKFTEKGEIRVSASQRDRNGFITLHVEDTGIGISEGDIQKIFEEFSQIENAVQKKVKGTGLGLPLSKKLAEVLGGLVEVESFVGKGSVFSLTIPLDYIDENTGVNLAEDQPYLNALLSNTLALIIDDNEATCYTLKRALNALAWTVNEARNGHSGLEIARKEVPDIIFLDLTMPGMNGVEVLERLKENEMTRNIPVIIHTSQILSASEREALSKAAQGIISKNMNFDELLGFAKELLSESALREAS